MKITCRNWSEMKKLLVPKGQEQEWIEEHLERHRNPQGPFDLERPNGTFFLINEYKISDCTQIVIINDVSANKQRAKDLLES